MTDVRAAVETLLAERDQDADFLVREPAIQHVAVPWYVRIIEGTCSGIDGCVYVEVGVETGASIRPVSRACGEVHGCDVEDCESVMPAGSTFWHMPSDRFFTEYDGPPPNVIFIDGLHTYDQAWQDYVNACRIIAPGGLIFLHDTCPASPDQASPVRPEDPTVPWCGDVYRLREELEALPVAGFTWRTFPGLTMIAPSLPSPKVPAREKPASKRTVK